MSILLRGLELLAVAIWLGSIVFFSFLNAPVLFRVLGEQQAGKAVRALFPRYYLLGVICGGVLAIVAAIRGVVWNWSGLTGASLALFVLLTGVTLYARQVLTPQATRARGPDGSRTPEFNRLHKRSVLLNGGVLVLLLFYMLWMAARGW